MKVNIVKKKKKKEKVRKRKVIISAAALFPSLFSRTPGSEGNPVIFHNTAPDLCSEDIFAIIYGIILVLFYVSEK